MTEAPAIELNCSFQVDTIYPSLATATAHR
jgi:hypothetical protein